MRSRHRSATGYLRAGAPDRCPPRPGRTAGHHYLSGGVVSVGGVVSSAWLRRCPWSHETNQHDRKRHSTDGILDIFSSLHVNGEKPFGKYPIMTTVRRGDEHQLGDNCWLAAARSLLSWFQSPPVQQESLIGPARGRFRRTPPVMSDFVAGGLFKAGGDTNTGHRVLTLSPARTPRTHRPVLCRPFR